tara:strand:+ start:351 stop:524 length:174 start_codon:yes stop_codon:yes gene_type:complete
MDMFRDLGPAEEKKFRQWARENYTPDMEVNSTWHPVVRDEIKLMQKASSTVNRKCDL